MPLQGQFETEHGLIADNAYALVYPLGMQTVADSVNSPFSDVTIHVWASVEAKAAGKRELLSRNYRCQGLDMAEYIGLAAAHCAESLPAIPQGEAQAGALVDAIVYQMESFILSQPEFAGWVRV